jgi:SLT domain-containing protein
MAPFVELEWGARAHGIMKRIKAVFDPHNLLNPGVILNDVSHCCCAVECCRCCAQRPT